MSGSTFIRAEYRRMTAKHKPVDGVEFFSYRTGVSRYARISADGQIMLSRIGTRSTYTARIIGFGPILGPSGRVKSFQTDQAAAEAAVKVWRKLNQSQRTLKQEGINR